MEKITSLSGKIIISEPIKNLTSSTGMLSTISKKFTNAGKGPEGFRYTEKTIIEMLDKYKESLSFSYKIISKKIFPGIPPQNYKPIHYIKNDNNKDFVVVKIIKSFYKEIMLSSQNMLLGIRLQPMFRRLEYCLPFHFFAVWCVVFSFHLLKKQSCLFFSENLLIVTIYKQDCLCYILFIISVILSVG